MNRYFEDTRYYLKRAGETATKGVKAELEPIEERFRELTGEEDAPEQGRLDEIKADLKELQAKAEGEAATAIANAREKLEAYRERDQQEA